MNKVLSTLKRKLTTMRRMSANADEWRLFILSRFPAISPTSYWFRWLYPAWWKYIFSGLALRLDSKPTNTNSSNRFLLSVPKTAGIGDQIVTSWSETYMLARRYGLTFVHHAFVRSPHDPETDWESFLGFGIGEFGAKHVLQNEALKTVWLPPISLSNQWNIKLLGKIINRVYRRENILFRLPTNIYFNACVDQTKILPAVYSVKYEAARRKMPFNLGFDSGRLHVSVHVRRGDLNTLKVTNKEQWKWRWISDAYYLNALHDLLPLLKAPFQIHVYSDGSEAELDAFSDISDCILHLSGDPRQAFHGLVSADILISSSSAFALCAGKISRGVKLIGRDFDHEQFRLFVPDTPDWVRIESTGRLSDHARAQLRDELDHRRLMRLETDRLQSA